MKKAGKTLLLLTILSLTFGLAVLSVKAEEKADGKADEAAVTELNQVMTILVDCDAKELPKRGAAGVISYNAGAPVWVIGETQDGWYLVSYQDKKGYIPKDYIAELQIEVEEKGAVGLNEAGLDEEMEALGAENKMVVEEIERQRSETRRSHIWTVIIVLLIIGIFATGIVSTVKSGKGTKEQNEDNNHETDHSDPML